jgi:hypothetical protein
MRDNTKLENAWEFIHVNGEFDSNKVDESDSPFKKHDEQGISTLRGIMIVSSDEFQNAENSIRVDLTLQTGREPPLPHWIQPRRRSPSMKSTSFSQFESYTRDVSG